MNALNWAAFLPFMLAGVLAAYHPIVYYCSNRPAINQILSPSKRITGIPAHSKLAPRAGQGDTPGQGLISFKFGAEGTRMDQKLSD